MPQANKQAELSRLAYSIKQASVVSTISRTGIFNAIREGRLRVRKHGRRTLIPHEDLDAFIKSLPYRSE